jgi:hypothetical protein
MTLLRFALLSAALLTAVNGCAAADAQQTSAASQTNATINSHHAVPADAPATPVNLGRPVPAPEKPAVTPVHLGTSYTPVAPHIIHVTIAR